MSSWDWLPWSPEKKTDGSGKATGQEVEELHQALQKDFIRKLTSDDIVKFPTDRASLITAIQRYVPLDDTRTAEELSYEWVPAEPDPTWYEVAWNKLKSFFSKNEEPKQYIMAPHHVQMLVEEMFAQKLLPAHRVVYFNANKPEHIEPLLYTLIDGFFKSELWKNGKRTRFIEDRKKRDERELIVEGNFLLDPLPKTGSSAGTIVGYIHGNKPVERTKPRHKSKAERNGAYPNVSKKPVNKVEKLKDALEDVKSQERDMQKKIEELRQNRQSILNELYAEGVDNDRKTPAEGWLGGAVKFTVTDGEDEEY